jgi:hypothetical protein
MVFEIEEYLGIFHVDKVHDFGTTMGKKLLADLEHPHMIFELHDEFLGLLEMIDIEGKDDFFLGVHGVLLRH